MNQPASLSLSAHSLHTPPHVGDVAVTGARVLDYIELMKPRVMSLVVFTGFVGLMVAPAPFHPLLGLVTILCIALSAGGSAAVNMWFDRDIDAVMTRTLKRPLPQGRIMPQAALEFGCMMIFFSVLLMALAVNILAAFLLASAALFYIFIYTMTLKRRTPHNIVIGGAAGAFPPVIAWAAVTANVDLAPLTLFALIFFWTPPHFWALALYRNDDYARAGIPMMPVVKGARHTRWEMLVYTLILLPVSLTPALVNLGGRFYMLCAAVLSLIFILHALRVIRVGDGDTKYAAARSMFGFSLFYLAALFAVLLFEHGMGWVG